MCVAAPIPPGTDLYCAAERLSQLEATPDSLLRSLVHQHRREAGLPEFVIFYKFIIDGGRWVNDPLNGLKEPDNFDGFNSLLNIA